MVAVRSFFRSVAKFLLPFFVVGSFFNYLFYNKTKSREASNLLYNHDYFSIDFHVHPLQAMNEGKGKLEDLVDAMDNKNLDAIAAAGYNEHELWPMLVKETRDYNKRKNRRYNAKIDGKVLRFKKKENKKEYFIIKAQEINSAQGIDAYLIGYDGHIQERDFGKIIKETHDKNGIAIGSTPYVNNNSFLSSRTIKPDVEEYLLDVISKPETRPDSVDWDAYCIPYLRYALLGEDVNKKAVELSKRKAVPIVAGTDLHPRNLHHLRAIGTSFSVFPRQEINIKTGDSLIYSIKENISKENHENHYQYVSPIHLWSAFGWPMLKEKIKAKFLF